MSLFVFPLRQPDYLERWKKRIGNEPSWNSRYGRSFAIVTHVPPHWICQGFFQARLTFPWLEAKNLSKSAEIRNRILARAIALFPGGRSIYNFGWYAEFGRSYGKLGFDPFFLWLFACFTIFRSELTRNRIIRLKSQKMWSRYLAFSHKNTQKVDLLNFKNEVIQPWGRRSEAKRQNYPL